MVNQKLAAILRQFDPHGADYDYDTAIAAGMKPQQEGGENQGHWGSVAQHLCNTAWTTTCPKTLT